MVDETDLVDAAQRRRPRRRSTNWCAGPTSTPTRSRVRLTGERGGRTRRGAGGLSPGLEGYRQASAGTRSSPRGCTASPRTAPPPTCRGAAGPRTEPTPRRRLEPADAPPRGPARGDGRDDARPRRDRPARVERAPAEAAGRRGAAGRLRPAPRGDRRGARDLAVGRQGPAAPGPQAAADGCSRRKRSSRAV